MFIISIESLLAGIKKQLFLVLVLGITLSCNTDSQHSKDAVANDTTLSQGTKNVTEVKPLECYRRVLGRDTLLLRLQIEGNQVSGFMAFDNFEKDSSHGTVEGKDVNNTILVWYRFNSEGMESVTQHAFRRSGTSIIPGIGELIYSKDSSYFKDVRRIIFDSSFSLKALACKEISTQMQTFNRQ